MRTVCLALAGALVSQSADAGTVRAEVCRRGDDLRTIEIVEPGVVGLACDVVYSRDRGETVSVPYNANVDNSFCRTSAAELAANLIAEGYECAPRLSDDIEASLAGGPAEAAAAAPTAVAEHVAEVVPGAGPEAQPQSELPLNEQLARLAAGSPAPTPSTEPSTEPQNGPSAEPQPALDAEPAAAAEPRDRIADLLMQPEAAPASEPTGYEQKIASVDRKEAEGGAAAPAVPVNLAEGARKSEYRAPAPPRSTGARRLVGAAPALDGIIDDKAIASSSPAPRPATPAAPANFPSRSSADIIKSVLAANAAAWNEGNLDAFMAGYADSAELMIVKDDVVVTGWKNVRQSYADEIAAGGMGRLDLGDLNVTIASNDVATVVGRYAVSRGGAQSRGVMTLVMKQVEGRWRILQDTRVTSLAPPPLND